MRTIFIGKDTEGKEPCVATIGFFDGVHRGHTFLIRHIIEDARKNNLAATVITFNEHPRKILHSDFQPRMLSTFKEKLVLLAKTGIDNCAVLRFDGHTAELSAHDFMQTILRDRLNARKLYIGYDNRFGHGRAEGFDDYVRYGHELGIEVIQNKAFVLNDVNISSSVIRSFLSEGEVEMAARCLGYPYILSGTVIHGVQEGRKMGFPTANILIDDAQKLIPATGVYAVKAHIDGMENLKNAMMNIGTRPTFGKNGISIEINILNFTGDLYGRHVDVMFMHRLREEHKFSSPKELARQLEKDRIRTEELLSHEKSGTAI